MLHTFTLKPSATLLAQRALHQLLDDARRRLAAWQHRRQAAATFDALNDLDARVLHDIGLDRSELRSVTAELAGDTARQRVLVLRSGLGLF